MLLLEPYPVERSSCNPFFECRFRRAGVTRGSKGRKAMLKSQKEKEIDVGFEVVSRGL